MEWDQIQEKWKAMTRRIRADLPQTDASMPLARAKRNARPALDLAVVAERSPVPETEGAPKAPVR